MVVMKNFRFIKDYEGGEKMQAVGVGDVSSVYGTSSMNPTNVSNEAAGRLCSVSTMRLPFLTDKPIFIREETAVKASTFLPFFRHVFVKEFEPDTVKWKWKTRQHN